MESIEKGLADNKSHHEIIRKVYLTYPTMVLVGKEEKQFEILDEICDHFRIPINHIQVCGSAKTGTSFFQNRPFEEKSSDLDVAIIDTNLYKHYIEWVFEITNATIIIFPAM
jgi:hypothetical protein